MFAETPQAQSARDKGFHETGRLSRRNSSSTSGGAESSLSYSSDSRAAVGSSYERSRGPPAPPTAQPAAHSDSEAAPAPHRSGAFHGSSWGRGRSREGGRGASAPAAAPALTPGAHRGSPAMPAHPHSGASRGAPSNGAWSTAPAAPTPAAEPTAHDAASGGSARSQRAERSASPRRTAAAALRGRSSSSQVAGAATAGAAVREGSSPQLSGRAERSMAWRGEVKQAQESEREGQSWEEELLAPNRYKPTLIKRGRRRLKRSTSRRP